MTSNTSPPVRVEAGSFLTLHYRLSGPAGDIINTFGGQPATLSLGTGELSPAIEQCLIGQEEGVRKTFELPRGAAFGERNPDMQQWLARKVLRQMGDPLETYRVGDVVQFPTPDGLGQFAGVVLQLSEADGLDGKGGSDDGAVLFDFNHPLAGHEVTFEVQLLGIL